MAKFRDLDALQIQDEFLILFERLLACPQELNR
jgi:hypothetical protein